MATLILLDMLYSKTQSCRPRQSGSVMYSLYSLTLQDFGLACDFFIELCSKTPLLLQVCASAVCFPAGRAVGVFFLELIELPLYQLRPKLLSRVRSIPSGCRPVSNKDSWRGIFPTGFRHTSREPGAVFSGSGWYGPVFYRSDLWLRFNEYLLLSSNNVAAFAALPRCL